jgi:hypothetical protein
MNIIYHSFPLDAHERLQSNIKLAKIQLGWQPEVRMKDGLKK